MIYKCWWCKVHSSRKQFLTRTVSLLGWHSDPYFLNQKLAWGKAHTATWPRTYQFTASPGGSLGWCETIIQKKNSEWEQQYVAQMYRNKMHGMNNVDNLSPFLCRSYIFMAFNFALAVYTAFQIYYSPFFIGMWFWYCLYSNTAVQMSYNWVGNSWGVGGKQNTYNESKVLHPLLDQLCYTHSAWKK